jgi:YtkA-like
MRTSLRTLLAAAFVSAACSSPNPGPASNGACFTAAPVMTTSSSTGALNIAVSTCPQPPSVGTNQIQLLITKASDGTTVDGLTVGVEPWMPSMGHGTSTTTVTPRGGGVYLVTEVYLYMQGDWALRTTISGPMSDNAAPQLEIQ